MKLSVSNRKSFIFMWSIHNKCHVTMNLTCHIFSEKLFKDMADRMVTDGYREAGYTYVSIDVSVQSFPLSQYILVEYKIYPFGVLVNKKYLTGIQNQDLNLGQPRGENLLCKITYLYDPKIRNVPL